jgi:cyclophilin family peptidyl-prolyl cis-trans isomerase
MIQTGQTNSTAINGGYLEDEFSETLLNLRGAVSMANTGYANTATTQFFINQTTAEAFEEKGGWEQILNGYRTYLQSPTVFTQYYGSWCDMSKIGMDIRELYETYGGTPSLDGAYTTTGTGYTVFGQVFEGMDVVDKIAAAETDDNDAPVNEDDYKVISVTFETYEG